MCIRDRYIPAYAEQRGVEFVINSFAKLESTPKIMEKSLKFDASVLISTKAIVDEIVFIPFCKNCVVYKSHSKKQQRNGEQIIFFHKPKLVTNQKFLNIIYYIEQQNLSKELF
eukprot:TRINITY_DN4730_c0_g1_i5.p2 TRINITY_DN4730_c0_g1~~TRINITY_DN4730_c0_g1_i5.p2  ORF type:complete len:113 (+),score=9.93 TRINITY_DN4730_c0_g1_i5:158-496(+)